MTCKYCDVEREQVIYEDEKLIAFLPKTAVAEGQITVVPKQHYRIFEEVPDAEVEHLFNVSNKLSALVFEVLGVHGTNIIVHNGTPGQEVPHFSINIIPRTEGDGLNLDWKPEKFSDDDMQGFELLLKDGLKEKKEEEKKEELEDIEKIEKEEGEENYLIKQLERMP
ncbi:HIT family protein [Candidatus Woesearchaeota archaeon]|nr:HIT family protein [Candidatus Woesearchaeota archaeon]MBW3021935.1 HIT family protein [Candidatus Woesearchaeota archaeon]